VFIETTWPNSDQPLRRLMIAQDTGSAIRGAARGDIFFGSGDAAGNRAGLIQHAVNMIVLLPVGAPIPSWAQAPRP
jgi:membrane-bound lytic murein transglycosylase A